jgi:hypothetical protein
VWAGDGSGRCRVVGRCGAIGPAGHEAFADDEARLQPFATVIPQSVSMLTSLRRRAATFSAKCLPGPTRHGAVVLVDDAGRRAYAARWVKHCWQPPELGRRRQRELGRTEVHSEVGDVEARIAEALLPLTRPRSASGPTAYIPRHLVEHAAAGGFLPYVDADSLRPVLGSARGDGGVAAQWRQVAYR